MSADWGTAWLLARRDLSGRFRGLRLLFACLFLGVAALAAIGTLTGAIEHELASRGRAILGGDLEVAVWQRSASADELAAMRQLGTVSGGIRLQAMATSGALAAPIELKAVAANWPLVGRLRLTDGRTVGAPPVGSTWIASGAAQRLALAPGGSVIIGGQALKVGGIIADEPDRLGEGFALGPAVIVTEAMPAAAGLTAPGAMYRSKYRIALPPGSDPKAAAATLKARFPAAGFDIRTRDKASPGAEQFVARMGDFLVLVGLAALAIAGIGIALGVGSWLEGRRTSIATLKVLGASSGDILRVHLLQVLAVSLLASVAGLIVGVGVTPLLSSALGALLPVKAGLVIDSLALARAAAFGLTVAVICTAPPLLAARHVPAMTLLRAHLDPIGVRWREALLPVGAGLLVLAALAFAGTRQPQLTAGFLGGVAALLALLGGLGWGVRWLAAKAPRPKDPILRLALGNLHRPGAQTGALVTALGFGLAAFVVLAAVQTSLDANIARRVPARAPDYFVLDLPRDRADEFAARVHALAPAARVRTVPALRGAILAYGPEQAMTRVADLKTIPDDAWPLRGERGLTYADAVPEGNVLTQGAWWPANYRGEPLVSVDEKLAATLGLHLGDKLTIGLLGVERSARIASLRRIDWDAMGFNYVLVFSPNAIADAPHNLAATINLAPGSNAAKGPLLRGLIKAFPATSVIEVGPVLTQARALLGQVSLAILAAASVAVLAGLAVLIGAMAAARERRTYDTVLLRVLGASRRQLLTLQLAEQGLLAAALALIALALGCGIGWGIVVKLFGFDWLPGWPQILGVLGLGLALVLGVALAGTLPLLRARPASALREL